jgi:hypothetical protein
MRKKITYNLMLLLVFFGFQHTSNAQTYELTASDVVIENGVITSCSYDYTITDIIIPNQINGTDIIGIGSEVFRDAPITTVVLPSSLVSIGQAAFRKSDITSIDLSTAGDGLVLAGSVFRQCSDLTSFTLSANVSEIGQYILRDASSLEEFIFEDGNTHITQVSPGDAITRPDATNIPLEKITFSDNIEIITENLFVFATQLQSVTFSANTTLQTIEANAFPSGKNITLPAPTNDQGNAFLHWLNDGQQLSAGTVVSDYSFPYTAEFETLSTSSFDEIGGAIKIINSMSNQSVQIVFNTKTSNDIKIEIFNLQGKKISTICDQFLSQGEYIFSWQNTASGLYILTFTINGKSKAEKFVIY